MLISRPFPGGIVVATHGYRLRHKRLQLRQNAGIADITCVQCQIAIVDQRSDALIEYPVCVRNQCHPQALMPRQVE